MMLGIGAEVLVQFVVSEAIILSWVFWSDLLEPFVCSFEACEALKVFYLEFKMVILV